MASRSSSSSPSSSSPSSSRGRSSKSPRSGRLQLPGSGGSFRSRRWYRVLRTTLLIGLLIGCLGVIVGASVVLYYTSDKSLPTIDRVSDYRPKVVTRILARDGRVIGELFEERRTLVPIERIPRLVQSAFIAAEDAQFFEHPGINVWAMVRSIGHILFRGGRLRGASTITQQLVKTYVLKSADRTPKRKVQEMYLSLRLEKRLSKQEILWIYLNQIYFGHGRYGIEEAARYYFGKSVSDLDAGEAAVLASLPKGPEIFSPRVKDPNDEKDKKQLARVKDRQRYVLSQMARYNFITPEEATRFANTPIRIVPEPQSLSGIAPEFVDEVDKVLVARFGSELPYKGLNVRTTCDLDVQVTARRALEEGLRRIDERNAYRSPLKHLDAAGQKAHLDQLIKDYPNGPPVDRIVEGVVIQVVLSDPPVRPKDAKDADKKDADKKDADKDSRPGWAVLSLGATQGVLPMSLTPDRYNPKGESPSKRVKVGDVLRVRVARIGREGPILSLESGPQGALVAIEPESREVLAMIGGYNYGRGMYNRALRARRQPGSAFKPFVYATAFDTREWTPASTMNDSPQVYDLPGLEPWRPKNAADHSKFMGSVRLRVALAHSLNTVASQLIYDLANTPNLVPKGAPKLPTVKRVIDLAHAAGIQSELEDNYSLALGSSGVSPMELTNAYATFAARGRRGTPILIEQLGAEEPMTSPLTEAISPDLAFLITSVMTSVIEEGTAISIKGKLRRPAAGKTGTTNSNRDAWFIGYTPEVCTGVWVGFDDIKPLGEKEQGARSALPIWLEVMQQALKDRRVSPFVQPAGVVVQRIDPVTGKLAAPGAPAIDEVFLEGTAPADQALAPDESDPSKFNMQ